MRRSARPVMFPEALVPDFITYIELRRAILQREFFLEYQPKVTLRTGQIDGVEALIRWQNRRRGRMAPERFLPQMERSALMGRLTDFVLDEAVAQCVSFRRQGIRLGVSINVSPSAVVQSLPSRVADALGKHDAEATWLTLEITETPGFGDLTRAAAILQTIRNTGVHLALDDFGNGNASLVYLQNLPIDELKIDRAFVKRAAKSPRDAEIVRFIAELGRLLHLRLTAEGVEDHRTLALLRADGIEAAQGYLFAAPLPPGDLLDHLPEMSARARRHLALPIDLRDRTTSPETEMSSRLADRA